MNISPISFCGIPKNFGIVDNILSRSAQPDIADLETLKNLGVTDIIDFRTHIHDPHDLKPFNEAKHVRKLGMKYHAIPSITRHPSPGNINAFLQTMDEIAKSGGKAHVHCKAGADRTGMYVFIYKHVKNLGNTADNIQEWLSYGHHKDLFPNLINKTIKLLLKMNLY